MAEAPKRSTLIRSALEALAQGNHAEAVRCCKHALKQDRRNYEAYVVLGKTLYASKQFEQAEASYKRAADISPEDSRAWQGLAELYEATGNYAGVVEACKAVICVFNKKGDVTHASEYTRRLANAYTNLQDHQNALDAWNTVLDMKPVPNTLLLECLSGIVESKTVLMESRIQESSECFLIQDQTLDAISARCVAENKFAIGQDGLDMEKALRDIHNEVPNNEKYETMLLQLLIWQLRASSSDRGHEWGQSCLQVVQLCISALSWHLSNLALVFLLAFCEEDNVDDVFSKMNMEELAQGRNSRLHFLGKRLVHAYPDQPLLMPVLAFLLHMFYPASFVQKKSICQNGLKSNQKSIRGWQVLAEMLVFEGVYADGIDCAKKGLEVVNGFRSLYGLRLQCAELELQLILADAYSKSGKLDEASEIYQRVTEAVEKTQDLETRAVLAKAREGQVKILLVQGRVEEASSHLASLLSLDSNSAWALAEQGWLAYQRNDFEQAISLLNHAVHIKPLDAKYQYKLGLAYWSSVNKKEKALNHWLESAKLDPNQSEVFRMLGHYYRNVPGGLKRAIRCYTKAISINCEDSEAGEILCDLLDSNDEEMVEYTVCQEATEKSPRAFWAFRRLGFIQVRRKEWSEAARNLQHAIRAYQTCCDVWEALGSAYQQLGMLTAALKAYGRVLNFDGESSLYAIQQSGNVLMMLGMYRKAVLMFQDAVDKAPEHPASLFGLAIALLGQAHECSSLGAVLWCSTLLKEASMVASRGLAKCRNIASFWKLSGDIEISYARTLCWEANSCSAEWSKGSSSGQHQDKSQDAFSSSVKAWKDLRLQAALRSKRAYQHALHIQPQKSNLYIDLCSCLHLIQQFTYNSRDLWRSSLEAESVAYSGLALEGSNADFWTSLGTVMQNKAAKQHAFIQAVHLDGNQALAWAELGQMYMKEGEHELAEEAFTRARCTDPMLGLTWAAMSKMLALNKKCDLKESFANISYAEHLSPIPSFQLGLAKFAAATYQLDSAQVYAAVGHAVLGAPHLPEVHNFKGLVCELQGQFNLAIAAFRMSRAAVDLEPVNLEPKFLKAKKLAASINLARVLCKEGNSHGAVEEYESLAKLGSLEDGAALRGYATALWQSGQQKLALSIAKVAVNKSASQSELCAALRLIAMFNYNLLGPAAALQDIDATDSHLQMDSAIAIITAAILVVGGMLTVLLQKMPKWITDLKHDRAAELASLLSASTQLHKDTANALHFLQKMLHIYPQSLSIRTNIMQYILERSNGLEVDVAGRFCSSSDMTRLEKTTDMQQVCQMLSAAAVACNSCGNIRPRVSFTSCNVFNPLMNDTIRVLQRWMHVEPWNIMSQYHLILSLLQQAREQRFPVNICMTIQRLTKITLEKMASVYKMASSDVHNYMQLQLLLCDSEAALHVQNLESAVEEAIRASRLVLPQNLQAFPHLQLARCYTVAEKHILAADQLERVGDLSIVDFPTVLCTFDLKSRMKKEMNVALALNDLELQEQVKERPNVMKALAECHKAEFYLCKSNLLLAETAASNAVMLWPEAKCLDLLLGAICLELAKDDSGSTKVSIASRKLMKAASGNRNKLPIAGLLLAQVQAGKSRTPGWERLLQDVWAIWPAECKPAELYYQMGVLAMASRSSESPSSSQECQRTWFKKAAHLNPACPRYWTMVLKEKKN